MARAKKKKKLQKPNVTPLASTPFFDLKWIHSDSWGTVEIPEKPPLEVTKVSAPYYGYRAWNLGQPSYLRGVYFAEYTYPGPVARNDEPPPDWEESGYYMIPAFYTSNMARVNSTGFHAYYSPTEIGQYYINYPVVGRVRCEGSVVEHEVGVRAQAVVIDGLILNPTRVFSDGIGSRTVYEVDADALAARYQCEVIDDAKVWRDFMFQGLDPFPKEKNDGCDR